MYDFSNPADAGQYLVLVELRGDPNLVEEDIHVWLLCRYYSFFSD
jgi:hypothetical protein